MGGKICSFVCKLLFSLCSCTLEGWEEQPLHSDKTADNLLFVEFPLVKLCKLIIPGALRSRHPEFPKASHAQWRATSCLNRSHQLCVMLWKDIKISLRMKAPLPQSQAGRFQQGLLFLVTFRQSRYRHPDTLMRDYWCIFCAISMQTFPPTGVSSEWSFFCWLIQTILQQSH